MVDCAEKLRWNKRWRKKLIDKLWWEGCCLFKCNNLVKIYFYLYHRCQLQIKGGDYVGGQRSLNFDEAIPTLLLIPTSIWNHLPFLFLYSHPDLKTQTKTIPTLLLTQHPFGTIFPLCHHCHLHFPFLLSPSWLIS